ncbi:MAG TPA: class I SAM-dependent rRNA methyltransferase [Candidatus Hydrogenedentes bacterium]|nr:class I SAM-dependent rRNA methyltransferase [Candidatus Hydrogenedentota bacterium]HPG68461.1 class I SAM-dependent rRNA methyltransferase [Candidatus Hydrogenedentota bacterium]
MKTARLKPKEERRLLRGHLWAYRNEFERFPDLEDGEPVDVVSGTGRFVGRGFYQAEGGIAVRILSSHQTDIGEAFFRGRIATALACRRQAQADQTVYRWLFGESDGLPGLVADRYGAFVSVQSACRFYEAHADLLVRLFCEHDGIEGVRLSLCGKVYSCGMPSDGLECEVDGVRMRVDVEGGQKTGLFLDQRENARRVRPYASGARVLDGHCYEGLWSCHAALASARHVLGVDTSEAAIERARANAQRNGVESRCTFECADVADVLGRSEPYDLVILDPPAYAKARSHVTKASARYQALNRAAMEIVTPGGLLVTSSCSHFVDTATFLEILKRAATAARRQAMVLGVFGAPADHPVLMAMPETAYLKCVFLRLP